MVSINTLANVFAVAVLTALSFVLYSFAGFDAALCTNLGAVFVCIAMKSRRNGESTAALGFFFLAGLEAVMLLAMALQ